MNIPQDEQHLISLNAPISAEDACDACAPPRVPRAIPAVVSLMLLSVTLFVAFSGDETSSLRRHAAKGTELASAAELNVLGGPLQVCSTNGMALTGFTRSGKCVEQDDDTGSHHICIELAETKPDFCTQTKQPDWCTEEMPCAVCQGDTCKQGSAQCPAKDWCVCQWAFTAYVGTTGCEHIQAVKCDAVNMQALDAYHAALAKDPHATADGYPIAGALACLKSKCKLS